MSTLANRLGRLEEQAQGLTRLSAVQHRRWRALRARYYGPTGWTFRAMSDAEVLEGEALYAAREGLTVAAYRAALAPSLAAQTGARSAAEERV